VKLLRRGAAGDAVRDVQTRLASIGYAIDANEHGWFGPSTERAVRAFQERRRLATDGIVGEHTWSELVEAGFTLGDRTLYLRYPSFKGDDVRSLQAALNLLGFDAGREDGIFGSRTDRAVQDFQRNVGLPSDGIVGATTSLALRRLRPSGSGPGHAAVREGEALRRLGATLAGARIALDPGSAPDEEGGPLALMRALEQELTRRGASPFVLLPQGGANSDSDRARAANLAGAEVLVSIEVPMDQDTSISGVATAYYGREGWHSQAGMRLAELIRQRLVSNLSLDDRGSHARSLPILRETRMPAVRVEPSLTTGPEDQAGLADPAWSKALAREIANGIEAFFAGVGPIESGDAVPAAPPDER
jgi:N-acetylmuramoyl-L-alanine amidase